ncbi:MAG: hypothetical protein AAGA83_20695 [Cyanobacteria bacterium P01_F01_bin.116]
MHSQDANNSKLAELADWLKNDGWEELSASLAVLNYCDRLWQKQTGRVRLTLYNYTEAGSSFIVELTGKSRDGYWTRYEKYGIQEDDLKDVLYDQVYTLIKAWMATNEGVS